MIPLRMPESAQKSAIRACIDSFSRTEKLVICLLHADKLTAEEAGQVLSLPATEVQALNDDIIQRLKAVLA